MEPNEFWRINFEALEQKQTETAYQFYERIANEYDKIKRYISRDLEAWYTRFGHRVTLTEARRLLTPEELKQFKADIKEYLENKDDLDEAWTKHLEELQERQRVSRLEEMQTRIQQRVEETTSTFAGLFAPFALSLFFVQYMEAISIIQNGLKVNLTFERIKDEMAEKLINKKWGTDGANFTSRVWTNHNKMVNALNTTLTQSIMKGDSVDAMVAVIAKRLDIGKREAGRLILTESAMINSVANQEVYTQAEVKYYELVATLDNRTSDICRYMDGKVFKMSEYEVAVTAPPFHAHCRTITIPYYGNIS